MPNFTQIKPNLLKRTSFNLTSLISNDNFSNSNGIDLKSCQHIPVDFDEFDNKIFKNSNSELTKYV